MVNLVRQRQEQLTQWINQLLEILRTQDGSTWKSLVLTVSRQKSIIDIDGILLQLLAVENPFQISIEPITEKIPVDFQCEAQTLRDIINGKLSIDSAVVVGKIFVRGNLQNLIGIHALAMEILADSAVNPALQRLWEDFDEFWLNSHSSPTCQTLEQQKPPYGYLIKNVPEDVLRIEIDPGI